MSLCDDLLEAIEGESRSGPNLCYDKVFDQIKEARIEDDDSLPAGDWMRAAKKADRVLVIKLAGETLAKRCKDLRLAGWYLESLLRKEGFSQLPGGVELLWKLQTEFWDSVHPEREEDGNLDLRIGALETAANLMGASLKAIPLTRSGFNLIQYQDAKMVGVETPDMSDEKAAARREAIGFGRATGEDLQRAIDGTPKPFYADLDGYLTKGLQALDELDEFQQEKYGDDYPSLGKLKSSIEDVKIVVGTVLAEKRKSDPDVDVGEAEPETEPQEEDYSDESSIDEADDLPVPAVVAPAPRRKAPTAGVPTDEQSAYAQIAAAAEFLRSLNSESPVPYLVCSALRLGETRIADLSNYSFAVAPPTETRQALRRLANDGNWESLLQECLRVMAEPCGRVWLDIHRYAWRAAQETSNYRLAAVVVTTVRGLLTDVPDLAGLIMDDDTPAANAETQQWIVAEILPPVAELPEGTQALERVEPEPIAGAVFVASSNVEKVPDIFDTAVMAVKRGRVAEAINMLVRDSEQQPSGRMRFQRRIQMAQLCLMANQGAVAYPVLRDLSVEMERRSLETWEGAEMLSAPLSLLLKCLDQRKASEQEREAIFERLCRLDPQAALTVRS